jgi:NCS1 family nucleobase:cation symporter-1
MTALTKGMGLADVESWGIRPVPEDRRRLRAWHFGVLWGDLAVSLLVMVAGALLVPGLGTKEAMLAIVVGTLIGAVLLAMAGVIGSETGVPTMVGLRAALGVRGSFIASAFNILQLVGWAAIEVIVMAQAARSLSDRYLGFTGYYFWIVFFGAVGLLMAVGGPIAVVRQWLQKFGVWVVVAASLWLTVRLFDVYDFGAIWRAKGDPSLGWPNFWQAVDLVVALPVSWLPLVGDYSRFARRAAPAAVGTYIGYSVANIWFFALGLFYVQALADPAVGPSPGTLVGDLVTSLLPLALGWLALIVLLVGESDEAFANIYSTAVSFRNLVPRLTHTVLAVGVGVTAIFVAMLLDQLGWAASYENFLLVIGGVFVPLFGIFLADFFAVRRGSYSVPDLYKESGAYWYGSGVNRVGLAVWLAGFVVYVLAAQPVWLIKHADVVSWAPRAAPFVDNFGGTIPAFAISFVLYWAAAQVWLRSERRLQRQAEAAG